MTFEICVRQTAWLPIDQNPAGDGWEIHSGNVTHNSWQRVFPLSELVEAAKVVCEQAHEISGHDLTDEMVAAIETLCPILGMTSPYGERQ